MCSITYYITLLSVILVDQILLVSSNILLPTSMLMINNKQSNILNNTIKHSSLEENPYNLFNISVISWNMAEKMPNEIDCQFIQSYKNNDLIIFGIQECEDLKYRRKEGSRTKKWKEIQLKYLNDFQHISTHKMGGLMLNIYGKKKILKLIQNIQLLEVACGVGNVLTNKGAICILLRFRNKKTIGFINSHFAAHINKVKQRNLDYHRVLQSFTERIPKQWYSTSSCSTTSSTTTSTISSSIATSRTIDDDDVININKDSNRRKKKISINNINKVKSSIIKNKDDMIASNKLNNNIKSKQNTAKIINKNKKQNNNLLNKNQISKKIISKKSNKIIYSKHKSLLNTNIKSTMITINNNNNIDNNINDDDDDLSTTNSKQWQNPIDAIIFFGDFNYRNTLPRLELEYFHRKYQQLTRLIIFNYII